MQTSKAAFLWEKGKSTTKKKDILKFYEVIFKNKCQIIWYKSQTPSFLRSGYIILAWSDNAAKGISQPFLHLPLGVQWLGAACRSLELTEQNTHLLARTQAYLDLMLWWIH